LKGGLSEAQAGCTIWKDISKETFERIVQFAYTGDYSIPKTEKRNTAIKPESVGRKVLTYQTSSSNLSGTQMWEKHEELSRTPPIQDPQEYKGEVIEEGDAEVVSDYYGSRRFGRSKKDKKKRDKAAMTGASSWRCETGPEEPPEELEESPVIRATGEKYPKPPSPRMLSADFSSLSFPLLAPRNNYNNDCEPAEQFEPDQSYSNVLLAHASLYIFGDYRLIDSLKALALYKLHKTLCVFQLDDENVEDIIDLARHAYSEEGEGLDGGIGGLRGLVCQYMATNAVLLSQNDGFMDLLEEGGQFVKDFFKFELQMIH
jgi:hypothetical protein